MVGGGLQAGVNYKMDNGMTIGAKGTLTSTPFMKVINPSHPHSDDLAPYAPAQLELAQKWGGGIQFSLTMPPGG